MKRTIGLVAAVILVGAFVVACNQKPAEPASTSVPSPTPAATEEPATSDLPSDAVLVEDTSLGQTVNQEVVDHGPSNEGATYEEEPSQDYETVVSQIMTEFGFSREKAEEIVQAGFQAAAEEQQRLEESSAAAQERIEQEFAESAKATNDYYLERYGITKDQAMGMSSDELIELFNQKHGG